jgi:hypothetical protein
VEKFEYKKLYGVEFIESHLLKILNRFAALKNLAHRRPEVGLGYILERISKFPLKSLGH